MERGEKNNFILWGQVVDTENDRISGTLLYKSTTPLHSDGADTLRVSSTVETLLQVFHKRYHHHIHEFDGRRLKYQAYISISISISNRHLTLTYRGQPTHTEKKTPQQRAATNERLGDRLTDLVPLSLGGAGL